MRTAFVCMLLKVLTTPGPPRGMRPLRPGVMSQAGRWALERRRMRGPQPGRPCWTSAVGREGQSTVLLQSLSDARARPGSLSRRPSFHPPPLAPGRLPSLGWFVSYGDTFKEVVLKSAPAGLGSLGGWGASWTRDVLQQ